MNDHVFRLLMTQTWQITALAIIVSVMVKLGAKNRPHLAHALWVLVLIKCVTPPLWGHSLGVFSQLQARLMPNPEHGQLETSEPDDLVPQADTEMLQDTSLTWDGGTDIQQSKSQSLSIEGDEAVQLPNELRAKTALAESAIPLESVESHASWLRPGWLLLSGLAEGAIMTMFIMVFRCLRCLREIHRHRTPEFDAPLRERIQHLSRQLRIRRIPQIIVSDVLFGPAVLGLLRHTIVLPRCLFETAEGSQSRSFLPERSFAARRTAQGQTSAQLQSDAVESISSGRVAASREVPPGRRDLLFLDSILAHELLHIRRGDLRTGTLQAIVQSLWWFHPAVWLSSRWLSREAERCCDEQVIAELGCTPGQYARSLLSVIECKHQLQPIPVFPGMKPVEITILRMERIMSLKNGLKKRTPIWCWLIVAGLAFVVLPGAVAKPSVDEAKPPATVTEWNPVVKESMSHPPLDEQATDSSKKKNAVKPPASPRLPLATYPVADLVILHQSVVSAAGRPNDSAVDAMPDVVPAAALTSGTAAPPDQIVDVAHASNQANVPTCKADFAPLTELIKATVQPDSWDMGLGLAVDEKTLSLVIQQTSEGHEEIAELLSQLRNAQDQNVRIQCTIFTLVDGMQSKWLEEQVSLHALQNGARWALLSQQRCESFTQALLEQKPEVLSRPVVRTTSGQASTITVGSLKVFGTTTATIGIRLEVTPQLLPDSKVIRLQHSVSIGDFANEMPQPVESLVSSGQTLLLLIDDPEEKENPEAARSQYLVMMTPEHILREEEDVSVSTPEDSALAVDPTD